MNRNILIIALVAILGGGAAFFAMSGGGAKQVDVAPQAQAESPAGQIVSRHAMMRKGLMVFLRYAIGKGLARRKNRLYWEKYLAKD